MAAAHNKAVFQRSVLAEVSPLGAQYQYLANGTFLHVRNSTGMMHIKHTAFGAIAAVLVLTGSVAASTSVTAKPHVATPLVLASQPGTPEDRLARQLMAHELWQSRRAGDNPLVFVRKTRFGGNEFLFVQIQSTGECGSAGCSIASFEYKNGKWAKVLDAIGGTIQVENSEHSGMPDLFIRESGRLIWDGTRYG